MAETPTTIKANPKPTITSRVPHPPRLEESLQPRAAIQTLNRYMWDLFQQFENGEILQQVNQSEIVPAPGETTNLPNPATSTIATAQKTANDATLAAATAQKTANAAFIAILAVGQIAISELDTTGTATFQTVGSAPYFASVTCIERAGGPQGSAIVVGVTKTQTSIEVEISTAPGVGNSVTFDFILIRKPVMI